MSSVLDPIGRTLRRRREAVTSTVTRLRGRAGAARPAVVAAAPAVEANDLRQRRDRVARRLAELQWDLGGLAYEMAIRDHFRVDVLVRVAADLQAVDVELAETERLLLLDESGAAGSCPGCSALHARGVAFCWRCGVALLASSGSATTTEALDPVEPRPRDPAPQDPPAGAS